MNKELILVGTAVVLAGTAVMTIIAQRAKIQDLKAEIEGRKVGEKVWIQQYTRACSKLNFTQLLELTNESINDIEFTRITGEI